MFTLAPLLAFGCTAILDFDRSGQPCDGAGRCLHGYQCIDRICVPAKDTCGGCPVGQRCLPASRRCAPDNCEFRHCPLGQGCFVDDAGSSFCRVLSPLDLGSTCDVDARCSAAAPNRVCLTAAPPRDGICVEGCLSDGGCATPGAACRTATLAPDGGASRFCGPDNTAAACASTADCADDGLVCVPLAHPNIGMATLCDSPVDGGSAIGATVPGIGESRGSGPAFQNRQSLSR